jgi:hypothetical protein
MWRPTRTHFGPNLHRRHAANVSTVTPNTCATRGGEISRSSESDMIQLQQPKRGYRWVQMGTDSGVQMGTDFSGSFFGQLFGVFGGLS